jgi:hypothetical protein
MRMLQSIPLPHIRLAVGLYIGGHNQIALYVHGVYGETGIFTAYSRRTGGRMESLSTGLMNSVRAKSQEPQSIYLRRFKPIA